MKHRDRVLMALNHEAPDRCPMQVSFTPEFASRLRNDLGLTDEDLHNPHGGGNTYVLERAIDEDMILTSVGWANSYYATEAYSDDGETYTDEWGVGWQNVEYKTQFGTGYYTEMVGHPLAADQAIDSYQPPDPHRPELYVEAERAIQEFKDEYWVVGVTVTTIFETAWALRGYDKVLMDFIINPDLLERLFDIPFHYHLAAAKKLVEMGVDMIWIGDDMGAQEGMLISPATWRRFFKPRLATFISTLKSINPEIKIAYHSDGDIYPIIPELIEIGLDVLNPIQPRCMDPEKVKKEYGDKLCFWGSIDEQYTLPFGTPAEVEREVIRRLKTLGRNGGLIIGPTHHVQLDTPLENFWAMVNTITKTPYSTRKRPDVERRLKIIQVETDEHRRHVRELFWEYLRWANSMLNREFGISFDINSMLEQDMVELDKFLPPEGRLLLGQYDHQIAGIACMRKIGGGIGEVKRMYVRPEYRRKGVGRALLEAIIKEARQIGYSNIRLDSTRFMKEAHALYRSAGFQDIEPYSESEIPEEYRSHWVFMEMALN